jgi:hypothetical protein
MVSYKSSLRIVSVLIIGFFSSLNLLAETHCTIPTETASDLPPSGTWRGYVFSDQTFTSYQGYYDQAYTSGSNFGMSTSSSWAIASNPSTSTSYTGCPLASDDNFSIRFRTTGLSSGVYALSSLSRNDSYSMWINGTQVRTNSQTTWTGQIESTDVVEFRLVEVTGNASLSFTFQLSGITPTIDPGSIGPGTPASGCGSVNASTTSSTLGFTNCTSIPGYFWESGPSSTGPWTVVSGATSPTYNAPNLTVTTFFRRGVRDYCDQTAYSNVIEYTVFPAPNAGSIVASGSTTVCINTGSYIINNAVAAVTAQNPPTYQWSSRVGGGAWSDITGATDESYTTGIISASNTQFRRAAIYTGTNGNCNTTVYSNVIAYTTQNPLAAPIITGSSNVCSDAVNVTYSTTTVANSYSWTVPTGATIQSGQSTNSIVVNYASYSGTNNITLSVTNTCGSVNGTLPITGTGSCTSTWTGNTSTTWGTAGNWSAGVPNATSTAVIPSGRPRYPTITGGTTSVGNLIIENGGSFTITGGTFNINGNFTTDGTFAHSAGTLGFTGAGAASFGGTTSPLSVRTLVINKTSGGSVALSSDINMLAGLTTTAGTLNTNGQVLLFDFNNGAFYAGTGSGSISGNVTIQRSIGQFSHYICTPLNGVDGIQLNDDTPVSNPSTGLSRLFAYNFATNGFTRLAANASLSVGSGYSLFFPNTSATVDMTGTVTNSSTFTFSPSVAGNSNNYGLYGNPFLASLDWNAAGWTKTNIQTNTYYMWSQSAQAFATFDGTTGTNGATRYIPPMQAFMIRSNGSATNLVAPRSASNGTGVGNFFFTATLADVLKVVIIDTVSKKSDEAAIIYADGVSNGYDDTLDVVKLMNPTSSITIYTEADTVMSAINYLSTPAEESAKPLFIRLPSTTNYTIKLVEENKISGTEYWLKDNQTGTLLSPGTEYTFQGTTGNLYNRFEIVSIPALATSTNAQKSSGPFTIGANDKTIVLNNKAVALSNCTVSVVDATGNTVKVSNGVNLSATTLVEASELTSGMYVVRIVDASGNSYSGRVVLK